MLKKRKLLIWPASCVLLLLFAFHPHVTEAQAVARSLSWSPDGNKIAYLDSPATLSVMDAFTSTQLLRIESPVKNFDSFAWKPDATQLATISHVQNDGLRIWNANDGKLIAHFDEIADQEQGAGIVTWAPDGSKIATGQVTISAVLPVHLWSAINDNFSLLSTINDAEQIYNMAWSPDSTQLAIADYRGLFIVNDISGAQPQSHKLPYYVYNLTWSPDSTKLALVTLLPSQQATEGLVHIINLKDPQKDLVKLSTYAIDLAWTKNGDRLAVGTGNEVQVWDPNTGQELAKYPSTAPAVTWSPFGGRLLYLAQPLNGTNSKLPLIQGGLPEFGVPAPTLGVLQDVLAQCAPPTLQRQLVTALNLAQLKDFASSVRQLTGAGLTAACGNELVAIADAIGTQ